MDGRPFPDAYGRTPNRFHNPFRPALIAAAVLCGAMLAAPPARGQAMGKAAVDLPPAPETVAALATPAAAPTAPAKALALATEPKPAAIAAAMQDGTKGPEAPAIVEAKTGPASLFADGGLGGTAKGADAAVTPAEPAAPTPPAAATATPTPPTPIHAPAAKPAASEIEQKTIRPRTEPAATQTNGTTPDSAKNGPGKLPSGLGNLAQVGAALAVVLGLVFVGKALAKKYLPAAKTAGGKGVIEVLARHPLAKNQSLVLVRIGSQIVALNQGKEASESVLVISDQAEVARIIGQIEGQSPTSIQAGFNKLLANARMDLERGDGADADEPGLRGMAAENLDEQLEEMAAAKRQLMELRQHVRSVRDSLPRG
jgi:hypothetical protein